MNMSKRVNCLLIAMIMALGLYGCKKEADVSYDVPTFTEIVKVAETVAEVESEPAEVPETTVATVPGETVVETEPEETKTTAEVMQTSNPESEASHSHSWKHNVTAPTCTTEGYTTHLCNCGAKEVDSKIAATGHTWDAWKTVTEATETSVGQAKRVCSACKASESRVLDKLPSSHKHSYTSTVKSIQLFQYWCQNIQVHLR